MKIAIKYCGGCNESYPREEVEKVIRKNFPDLEIFYSKSADFVIFISGCKKGCAIVNEANNFVHFDCKRSEEEIVEEIKRALGREKA
ncbi:MAG: hypothetical protein ACK401_03430 [Archaeoglobaceae archaeon]